MQDLASLNSVIRRSLRRDVLDRDGWQCVWCGTSQHLTLHHIIPVRRGGNHSTKNLVTFCRECHDEIELMEAAWEQRFGDEALARDARAFVDHYTAAQGRIGQRVSTRDEAIIRELLSGSR